MMMPGFSAETSLYRSSLAYCQLAIAAGSRHQAVRPALDSCTCPRRIAPVRVRPRLRRSARASRVAH